MHIKVNFQKKKWKQENRDNIYNHNHHNEYAFSSFNGNKKLEEKKIIPIIMTKIRIIL